MSDDPAQNGGPPDEVENEEQPKPKSGEEAKAARSMNAMQANQEPATSADVDDAKLATAMTNLTGGAKTKKTDEPTKKVVLKKEDVTMTEFEISKAAAEKALRQNHGELIATINQLINV